MLHYWLWLLMLILPILMLYLVLNWSLSLCLVLGTWLVGSFVSISCINEELHVNSWLYGLARRGHPSLSWLCSLYQHSHVAS